MSPLYIEMEGCRAVVMAYLALAVYEIVGSVTAESLLRERAGRRCGSFEPVSLAPCTPLARKGCVTSNFAKRGVWALNSIGPK